MRWALAAFLFACGSRSDLSPPPSLDASVVETGSPDVVVDDVVVADVGVDANGPDAFLDELGVVAAIAVDDTNVYFSNFYPFQPSPTIGQGILSCSKSGCNGKPTLLVAQNAKSGQLIHDAKNLYWLKGDDVLSCALSGCNNQPSTLTTALSDVMGNATTGNLFAFTVNAYYHGTVDVCSMPSCTTPTMIADGQVAPAWVTFDATNVYWTNTIAQAGTIMQCALAGCGDSPIELAGGQNVPSGIAVDPTSVYWQASGVILKCAIGGCGNEPTKIGNGGGFARLVVDGSWIYFANSDGFTSGVYKCPVTGCVGSPIPVLVTSVVEAYDFAVDATFVWGTFSASNSNNPWGGKILRAPK